MGQKNRACLFTSFTAEAEEKNGERDGDEAEVDYDGVDPGENIDGTGGLLAAKAQGLEDRSNPVAQVGTEQGHRDDVEDCHKRIAKSDDDHFPGVVALGAVWHDLHEGGVVGACFHREVKKVKDDESQNRQATPDHDE